MGCEKLNKGREFIITIPTSDYKVVKHQELKTKVELPIFINTKILVVDDVPTNLFLIEAFLEQYDIKVKTLESAVDVVRETEEFEPDMILMDLRMPLVDGTVAAKMIKENEKTSHIPVIAFTASLMDRESILSNNSFSGILGKPVSHEQLFKILDQFLAHKSRQPAQQAHLKGSEEKEMAQSSPIRHSFAATEQSKI